MNLCFLSNGPFAGFKTSMYSLFASLLKKDYQITLCLILKEDKEVDLSDLDTRVKVIRKIVKSDGERKIREKHIWHPTIFKFYLMLYRNLFSKNKKFKLKYIMYYNQIFNKFFIKGMKETIDLSEYDAVISFEETFNNYLLADKIIAKKKIGFIHPDYEETHFSRLIDRPFLKKLDKICLVSDANYKSFCKAFPILKKKARSIVNLLDTDLIDKKMKNIPDDLFAKSNFDITTVCRFENAHKALDRAVLLAERLKNDGYNFKWYFVGNGEYFETMKQSIVDKNLQNYVFLYGNKSNPYPYIKNSDLFVLQSHYEGYPMCVLEAIYLKVPVLVSNFKSAFEIVKNDRYGIVAENNFDAIYEKLVDLITDKNLCYSNLKQKIQQENVSFGDCSPFENIFKE